MNPKSLSEVALGGEHAAWLIATAQKCGLAAEVIAIIREATELLGDALSPEQTLSDAIGEIRFFISSNAKMKKRFFYGRNLGEEALLFIEAFFKDGFLTKIQVLDMFPGKQVRIKSHHGQETPIIEDGTCKTVTMVSDDPGHFNLILGNGKAFGFVPEQVTPTSAGGEFCRHSQYRREIEIIG